VHDQYREREDVIFEGGTVRRIDARAGESLGD